MWTATWWPSRAGNPAAGVQIHVEDGACDHEAFRPGRLMAGAFKLLRRLRPDYELWRDFPNEYEFDRFAIDLINGSELLCQGVDDPESTPDDLDALARPDETHCRNCGLSQIILLAVSLTTSVQGALLFFLLVGSRNDFPVF